MLRYFGMTRGASSAPEPDTTLARFISPDFIVPNVAAPKRETAPAVFTLHIT